MSSIKVVDINNEEVKQEEAIEQPIEEVKEEVNEVVEKPPIQEIKEVIEEETKEQPKVKAQDATQESCKPCDKMVRCPKCNKEMKYKNFRYGHQQKCQGGIENKPVKPHTKARAKPIIKQVEVNEHASQEARDPCDPQEEQKPEPKPVIKQQSQPSNPLTDITNHYQLLQNQYIQQKKEKYNNLCQSMFAPKSKKR